MQIKPYQELFLPSNVRLFFVCRRGTPVQVVAIPLANISRLFYLSSDNSQSIHNFLKDLKSYTESTNVMG